MRRIGTGFALGRKLAELGGAYLASVDQVQEFYDACRLRCKFCEARCRCSCHQGGLSKDEEAVAKLLEETLV